VNLGADLGGRFKRLLALGLLALVASCAEVPKSVPVTPPVPPVGEDLSILPGFDTADMSVSLQALRAACLYKKGTMYEPVCKALKGRALGSPTEIRAFLKAHFRAESIDGEGMLTAYFVPEYPASLIPDAQFSQAVRTRPTDLLIVDGALMMPTQAGKSVPARKVDEVYLPYYTRAEIEAMPSDSSVFMRPEDYFFMQLQGSGYLTLPDGRQLHASYNGDNGLPFTGIAKPMIERGILSKDNASGDNIRAWLAQHRGPEAREIMNLNARYAFFIIESDIKEPVGAANVALPPHGAVAIDPAYHAYGELLWIDANAGNLTGAYPVYQQLVAALDTGGAIKGNIRADLYMGRGAQAGTEAGRVRHKLKMWRLLPLE
jgi:membrane-bound lytic murein transglycosylase A